MIPVFKDTKLNEVLIAGIEVEFFKDKTKSFCDGLRQILSFRLFGFDNLVLWHIFSGDMKNKNIERKVRSVTEIIEGFNLMMIYFATKLAEDFKFEFFAPWELYSSRKVETDYILCSLKNFCYDKKNPLLNNEEVEKRKKMLKILLKIAM